MKAMLFLYVAIMLYKDNYSQYKSKDECDKAPSSFLNVICPFWANDNSKCINGINEENICTPPPNNSIIIYIISGIISAIISVIFFYYGFKKGGSNSQSMYSYDEYKNIYN
jgi:drug/metabolite transporter (DMT)-like permease